MDFIDSETSVVSYWTMIWGAIASVGWYVLGTAVVMLYASPYIRERYSKWKRKWDEREYAAKYHKNPDLAQERLSAIDAARHRMQEEYQRKAAVAFEQEKERKEKKREVLKSLDANIGGHRLGGREDDSNEASRKIAKSKSLKQEYNPLTGDNSRGYRPPKRSCCRGGGCG